MVYLVDTNILLRIFDRSDTKHWEVVDSLKRLRSEGHSLATTPQNIAEFWNVSTRPTSARGGYGQPSAVVERRVRFIERMGQVLPEQAGTYSEWRRLVMNHGVVGVSVHDSRLVAAMNVAGVTHILTLNSSDFRRYPGITAVAPLEVLHAP